VRSIVCEMYSINIRCILIFIVLLEIPLELRDYECCSTCSLWPVACVIFFRAMKWLQTVHLPHFVAGHLSTTSFVICCRQHLQTDDLARPHLCKFDMSGSDLAEICVIRYSDLAAQQYSVTKWQRIRADVRMLLALGAPHSVQASFEVSLFWLFSLTSSACQVFHMW